MSQFGAEKFTTRSREVIEAAQLAATTGGNTHTEAIHLLVALLQQEDGSTRSMVLKAGVDPADLLAGRLDHPGVAVARAGHPDPGGEVQVLAPVRAGDPAAPGGVDDDRGHLLQERTQ